MTRNLDTALLRSFVTVVETGSMTRAAARLHLTQAAVSQQIRRLEEMLGQALLSRQRLRIVPTAAGDRLLGRAQRLLALNDEIWAALTAAEIEGEVRLGMPHDLVAGFIPPILKAFDQDRPRVRVAVLSATSRLVREATDRGELDLCVGTEREPGPGCEVLFSDPLLWVGARGGSAWARTPLPLSVGDSTCAFRGPALEVLSRVDWPWRFAFETSDMLALTAGVAADLAVTAMLASTVPTELEPVPAEAALPPLPTFHVTLLVPPGRVSAATGELAALIRRRLTRARLAA